MPYPLSAIARGGWGVLAEHSDAPGGVGASGNTIVLVPEITATHWWPPASLLMSSPPTAPSNLCCLMFPAGLGVESIGNAVHVAGKH